MPRHRSSAAKLLLGAMLALVGCADRGSEAPTGPADLLRQSQISTEVVCVQASPAGDLIDCLFPPPGLRNAAQRQLVNIVRQFDRGQVEAATGMMFDLVDFTLSRKELGQLLDPQPLGQDAAVSLLFDALFQAVGMDPPEIPEGALGEDGAVSVVSPLGGDVFTGTRLFGMNFGENAFHSDVLVTLTRLSDPAVGGEGPLPTDMDQYGPFYELRVNPAVESIDGLTSGLCYYDTGPLAPPDDPAVRSALRIARTVPGTDDEIKLLAWVEVPSFIDCSDVTQVASLQRREARILARLGEEVGSFLAWALGPAPLAAGSNGGATDTILVRGGEAQSFSTVVFATGDPTSQPGPLPDLVVVSTQVIPSSPVDGFTFSMEAVVKNIGQGSAAESQLRFHHAGTGAVDALVPVGPLAPQESETVSYSTALAAGEYADVVAYADFPDDVEEDDEGNNSRSFTFTVVERSTITGHVWVDGTGVTGVTVAVTGAYTLYTATDANGEYSVSNLAPGTYTVSVSASASWHFAISSKSVTVAPGATGVVDFSGASLWNSPVGTGPATTWTVVQPTAATSLCNGSGPDPCAFGGSTVTVTAVATGPTGTFPNPWAGGNVYFYYIHPDLGAFFVSVVNGNVFMVEDDGMTTRSYTWTTTFDALGIPAAATPGQFVAVAVASGSRYATPPNGSVLVVNGALGGDG